MRSKPLTPEGIIKLQVKRYMQWKKWFIFPVLQGIGAHKGISDFIAVKDGRVLFIETKTPKNKQSSDQKEFEQEITSHGGEYFVVRSLDEMIEIEEV